MKKEENGKLKDHPQYVQRKIQTAKQKSENKCKFYLQPMKKKQILDEVSIESNNKLIKELE